MKKLLLSFTGIMLCAVSCITELPENTGKLVIQNNSGQKYTVITDVWVKEATEEDWTSRWAGSVGNGHEITIVLDVGYYDVRIRTAASFYYDIYESAYKQPVHIKEKDYLFLVFDGKGIYNPYK